MIGVYDAITALDEIEFNTTSLLGNRNNKTQTSDDNEDYSIRSTVN